MCGSGKLLRSGGTLAQARRHRQEVGSLGRGQANLSGMRARNGRRCPRPGRARGGGRAPLDGWPRRSRLPEGPARPGGRCAGQRHHARCRPHFPGMGRARRADAAGLHRAALHQWPEPGDRHGAQGRAHLRSAQCLPGHAAADLDHHRAADHRSGDRSRGRHVAPHLLGFELAVAGRGGGDPGRTAAGRAQLQVADRPARHGPHRAGEAHAARHQDGYHLDRTGGARSAEARRGGRRLLPMRVSAAAAGRSTSP